MEANYLSYFKLISTTSLPLNLCIHDKSLKEFRNLTYLLSYQCFVFLHQYLRSLIFLQVNKNPLRPVDPSRLMNVGPDFTPSYLGNLGRGSVGGPRGPVSTFLQLSMLVYYEATSFSHFNEFVLLKKVPFLTFLYIHSCPTT